VFRRFRDAKISIPYPQQDIHIRSMPATVEKPTGKT
jgi:small-conductance mechanosensitive channel